MSKAQITKAAPRGSLRFTNTRDLSANIGNGNPGNAGNDKLTTLPIMATICADRNTSHHPADNHNHRHQQRAPAATKAAKAAP